MTIIVYKAEEGGYWAEVLEIPGCATQGDTLPALFTALAEAIEGCESTITTKPQPSS